MHTDIIWLWLDVDLPYFPFEDLFNLTYAVFLVDDNSWSWLPWYLKTKRLFFDVGLVCHREMHPFLNSVTDDEVYFIFLAFSWGQKAWIPSFDFTEDSYWALCNLFIFSPIWIPFIMNGVFISPTYKNIFGIDSWMVSFCLPHGDIIETLVQLPPFDRYSFSS